MITITIILFSIMIITGILYQRLEKRYTWCEKNDIKIFKKTLNEVLEIIGFTFWIALILCIIPLIGIPSQYFNTTQKIRKIEITRETIKEVRENGCELERAALIQNLISSNKIIRELKHDNTNWLLKEVTPDEVDKLEYLK